MHGCLDGLSRDLNLLSGAWVFSLQRDEEGVGGYRVLRSDIYHPPNPVHPAPTPCTEPVACCLSAAPSGGDLRPDLAPLAGGEPQGDFEQGSGPMRREYVAIWDLGFPSCILIGCLLLRVVCWQVTEQGEVL